MKGAEAEGNVYAEFIGSEAAVLILGAGLNGVTGRSGGRVALCTVWPDFSARSDHGSLNYFRLTAEARASPAGQGTPYSNTVRRICQT